MPVTPETKKDQEARLGRLIDEYHADLVVLALYMQRGSPWGAISRTSCWSAPCASIFTRRLELGSEKREAMAREARNVCDNFTVKMMSDRTLEVYQQLLAGAPAR